MKDILTLPSGGHLFYGESRDKLRAAGKLLAAILQRLCEEAVEGNTTEALNLLAEQLIADGGAEPLFKGFENFPFTTCLSNNDTVVHGFPNDRELMSGDVLSIDTGLRLNGFCSDAARTVIVGGKHKEHEVLVRAAIEAYEAGVEKVKVGVPLGDVGHAISKAVLKYFNDPNDFRAGFTYKVFPKFEGHGIGLDLHEPPAVCNFGYPGYGIRLQAGMCFTIEPVVMYRSSEILSSFSQNCLQFHTSDGKPSSHHENTLLLTEEGLEVLTYTSVPY